VVGIAIRKVILAIFARGQPALCIAGAFAAVERIVIRRRKQLCNDVRSRLE
jgi:hypothetical protein